MSIKYRERLGDAGIEPSVIAVPAHRLLEPIRNIPLAEADTNFYTSLDAEAVVA